jgi:hypothetical protein
MQGNVETPKPGKAEISAFQRFDFSVSDGVVSGKAGEPCREEMVRTACETGGNHFEGSSPRRKCRVGSAFP